LAGVLMLSSIWRRNVSNSVCEIEPSPSLSVDENSSSALGARRGAG
jgi:hypothetical protein